MNQHRHAKFARLGPERIQPFVIGQQKLPRCILDSQPQILKDLQAACSCIDRFLQLHGGPFAESGLVHPAPIHIGKGEKTTRISPLVLIQAPSQIISPAPSQVNHGLEAALVHYLHELTHISEPLTGNWLARGIVAESEMVMGIHGWEPGLFDNVFFGYQRGTGHVVLQ
ncbi:hypothetical protein ES703_80379 [subsurface metagenome]